MKQTISLLLSLTALIALSGCGRRGGIFDFYANPVQPPVSGYPSGTYDKSFNTYLDKGDDFYDSRIYYTFDPELPYTELGAWIDYYASGGGSISVDRSMGIRLFAYASPTEFSEVRTIDWELKCPTPGFTQEPGAVTVLPASIGIKAPWEEEFLTYYTTDGSDPASPDSARYLWTHYRVNDPADPADDEYGTPPFFLDEYSQPLTLRVIVQREGWSDSDPVTGTFSPTTLTAALDFTIELPNGTVVSFTGQTPLLRVNQDAMSVSAQPSGMAKYEWSLNGIPVCLGASPTNPYLGSSLSLGYLVASNNLHAVGLTNYDLSALDPGNYTLTCIATDGNGFAYSNSIFFLVTS